MHAMTQITAASVTSRSAIVSIPKVAVMSATSAAVTLTVLSW